MQHPLLYNSIGIQKLLEAVLLNIHSVDSIGLNQGKSGFSLCLFEVAHCLNDPSIEDKAFQLLQEVLALRQKGVKAKPLEIGFVLLYLIENKLIEADFDDLFGEDTAQIINSIRFFSPYSELQLLFIPFLSLLWKLKKESPIRQLAVEILDGAALSLQNQSLQLQRDRLRPGIQQWETSFTQFLKASSLINEYIPSLQTFDPFTIFYQKNRITNRFETGFYLEKLAPENLYLSALGKEIQHRAAENIFPGILTLSQRIKLLYLLRQKAPLYKNQIQQLEKDLFNCENPRYEQKIAQMVPLNQSVIGYEAGIARILLYRIYTKKLAAGEEATRFQYIFP